MSERKQVRRFTRGDRSGDLWDTLSYTAKGFLREEETLLDIEARDYPIIYELVPVSLTEVQRAAGRKGKHG